MSGVSHFPVGSASASRLLAQLFLIPGFLCLTTQLVRLTQAKKVKFVARCARCAQHHFGSRQSRRTRRRPAGIATHHLRGRPLRHWPAHRRARTARTSRRLRAGGTSAPLRVGTRSWSTARSAHRIRVRPTRWCAAGLLQLHRHRHVRTVGAGYPVRDRRSRRDRAVASGTAFTADRREYNTNSPDRSPETVRAHEVAHFWYTTNNDALVGVQRARSTRHPFVRYLRKSAVCSLFAIVQKRRFSQRRIAARHTHHINRGCNGNRSHSPAIYPADASAARA